MVVGIEVTTMLMLLDWQGVIDWPWWAICMPLWNALGWLGVAGLIKSLLA